VTTIKRTYPRDHQTAANRVGAHIRKSDPWYRRWWFGLNRWAETSRVPEYLLGVCVILLWIVSLMAVNLNDENTALREAEAASQARADQYDCKPIRATGRGGPVIEVIHCIKRMKP